MFFVLVMILIVIVFFGFFDNMVFVVIVFGVFWLMLFVMIYGFVSMELWFYEVSVVFGFS